MVPALCAHNQHVRGVIFAPLAAEDASAPQARTPLLRLRDYSVGFHTTRGRITVVDRIALDLAPGEILALVGESGSGKSVTCRSLIGLAGPNAWRSGEARLGDLNLTEAGPRALDRLRGRRIAMVFQTPTACLDPIMSIGRHLVATLRRHQPLTAADARDRAVDLLRQVGIPEPERRLAAFPHELSGGMNQRVMIALALAGDPDLLIADEPTTALDVTLQAQILVLLRRLVHDRGLAMLLVTHDLGLVAQTCDRVAILYAGRVVEVAPVAELFANPRHRYTQALLRARPRLLGPKRLHPIAGEVPTPQARPAGCAFAPRCLHADDGCRAAPPPLRPLGHTRVACRHPAETDLMKPEPAAAAADDTVSAGPGDGQPILAVERLSRHFPLGRRLPFRPRPVLRAVDQVTLALGPGRTLGLVGESGCGKSTLGRMIIGLTLPTDGTLQVAGATMRPGAAVNRRQHARRVQMVFQDPGGSLDPRLPAGVQIAEPLRVHGRGRAPERAERARGLLDAVGLPTTLADAYPHQLSGGQIQRVAIARALVLDPPLLVCDEPTSALDVSVQAQVVNLLARIQQERRLGLLFISHDLGVVRSLADEIAVMYLGAIVESGPSDRLLEAPAHPYTQALIASVPEVAAARRHTAPALGGEPASAAALPAGCRFQPRCPMARPACREAAPALKPTGDGRQVACHVVHGDA